MSLEIPYGIKVLNPVPVDAKYLNDGVVYADITQVNTTIPSGIRHIGLTVNIANSEYWYASGITDTDLVLKLSASGSTINGAQNVGSGSGIYSGVTPTGIINLRSIIGSGNTDVSISGDTLVVNSIDSTALQNGILRFDTGEQTFQPYNTFTTGVTFYYGDVCPTGGTRLNLNALLAVTELRLSTGSTHAIHDVGDIYWDIDDSTISIQQTTEVKQQVGQELYVKARNSGATTIENGAVVYISGSVGGRPTIALARASSVDTSIIDEVIGMVTEDIPAGQDGFVTTSGLVREINTSGYTEGDIVFLSTTSWGGITKDKPEFPNYTIEVGIVVNADASDGSIYIKLANITVGQTIRGVETANIEHFSATTRSDFIGAYNNRHIYLPPIPRLGQEITVSDSSGDADPWSITIHGSGKKISGTSYTGGIPVDDDAIIDTSWGSITLLYNGTFWNVISSVG